MSGYLTHWRGEPDTPAGRILRQISRAGDVYHHTEHWVDDDPSEADKIESVVTQEIDALCDQRAELLAALVRIEAMAVSTVPSWYSVREIASAAIAAGCAQ